MKYVSRKLAKLQAYDPGTVSTAIRLDSNESFLSLPETLRESIADRITSVKFNRYPDPIGKSVCKAFGQYYNVDPQNITLGNGSDELIFLLFNTFLQKGDRALLVNPDFSMYPIYCGMAEIDPITLKKNESLTFDPDELISLAKKQHPKMVLFSNPCNPTSQGISAKDVLEIVDNLDCLVVIDEAYMDFWNEAIYQEAPKRKNCIVLKTLSKVGLASVRLGFAIANNQLSIYLRTAKSPYNVNTLTQIVGETVLLESNYLHSATQQICASRDALYNALKPYNGPFMHVFPAHANFVTIQTLYAEKIQKKLRERGISIRCIGQLLRITAGTLKENQILVNTFSSCIKEGL